MALFYRMQMLLAAYALLLTSFTLATSRTTTTTSSKEEIKCDTCIPVSYPSPPPPPPLVIECPPPPSPPPPPKLSPPPPKPTCPSCAPPCYACQNPTTPLTPAQPVIGGGVYSPNQVVPYFQYGYQYPPPSAASTARMGLKLFVSVLLLTLSATLS